MNVACTRYRVTEENRAGGYCSFDMSFVEYGQPPVSGSRQSAPGVEYAATKLGNAVGQTRGRRSKPSEGARDPHDPDRSTGSRRDRPARRRLAASRHRTSRTGRAAADLRRACGDMQANAERYIVNNTIGAKLSDCFDQARLTGATLDEFNRIREAIVAEDGGVAGGDADQAGAASTSACSKCLSCLCGMTFTSREDVDCVRGRNQRGVRSGRGSRCRRDGAGGLQGAGVAACGGDVPSVRDRAPAAADARYQFGTPRPTLVLSHRLYDTAARADQLREENKVVHPAFAPRAGQALSF